MGVKVPILEVQPESFAAFEKTMQGVMAVPKSAIDAAIAAEHNADKIDTGYCKYQAATAASN